VKGKRKEESAIGGRGWGALGGDRWGEKNRFCRNPERGRGNNPGETSKRRNGEKF